MTILSDFYNILISRGIPHYPTYQGFRLQNWFYKLIKIWIPHYPTYQGFRRLAYANHGSIIVRSLTIQHTRDLDLAGLKFFFLIEIPHYPTYQGFRHRYNNAKYFTHMIPHYPTYQGFRHASRVTN